MTPERRMKYWLALQLIFGQGSPYINEIVEKFGTALDFFRAGEEGWNTITDILPLHLEQLAQPDIPAVEQIIADCEKAECKIITPEDESYPEELRHIYGMPAVLYVLGDLSCLKDHLAIAMVGTRECTSIAVSTADKIAKDLARHKVVVVSGMALGIDAACHWGAINGGSKTVAFLSCGLDQVYPQENTALWSRICANGAVVSEYPPGTSVTRHSFHVRNRLISGVSRGVVMVQGAQQSGTNITITHGLEQGKEIFVVPWNIDTEEGRWAVQLLREGAIAISDADQILEEYGYLEPSRPQDSGEEREQRHEKLHDTVARKKHSGKKASKTAGKEQTEPEPDEKPETAPAPAELPELEGDMKLVYDLLGEEELEPEEIAERIGVPPGELTVLLTEMEVLGILKPASGGGYLRG